MLDLALPPQIYLPHKPAIIRAHRSDLSALEALEREKGIRAVLPGLTPIVASVGGPAGQQVFTSSGTFVVPAGVTRICAVCVGAGANSTGQNGGRGGDLRYINNLAVTPGESLTITVGTSGGLSRIARGGTNLLTARGGTSGTSTSTGGDVGGGNGGNGASFNAGSPGRAGGGGGAGGYSGNGGAGSNTGNGGTGSGGAGGGGGAGYGGARAGGAGGGVGLLGQGSSGAGGTASPNTSNDGTRGAGGSGGTGGGQTWHGGSYGGGASSRSNSNGDGGPGAVRIIWGEGRAYPSTNTGDV